MTSRKKKVYIKFCDSIVWPQSRDFEAKHWPHSRDIEAKKNI